MAYLSALPTKDISVISDTASVTEDSDQSSQNHRKQQIDLRPPLSRRSVLLDVMVPRLAHLVTIPTSLTAFYVLMTDDAAQPNLVVDRKDAIRIYKMMNGLDGFSSGDLRTFAQTSSGAIAVFANALYHARYGFPYPDVENLLRISMDQRETSTFLILANLTCKVANVNDRTEYAVNELIKIYQNHFASGTVGQRGHLSEYDSIFLSQILPCLYSSIREDSLYTDEGGSGWADFRDLVRNIESRYIRLDHPDYVSIVSQRAKSAFELDFLLKIKTYYIMYELRCHQNIAGKRKEKYSEFIIDLACNRSRYNPRESLVTLSPIIIALLDAGYIECAQDIANFISQCYAGSANAPMADKLVTAAEDQMNMRSLEYGIFHMCRNSIIDAMVEIGRPIDKAEYLRNARIICNLDESRINISAFRAAITRYRGIIAHENGDENVHGFFVRNLAEGKKSHRAFFLKTGHDRFLRIFKE